MFHQSSRIFKVVTFVLVLTVLGTGNAFAVDPVTVISVFNTLFSGFKNLNSMFDGTDSEIARAVDQLIEEMYKIDAASVSDDARWLVHEYREISENATMTGVQGRFENFLARSNETFFDLERRLTPGEIPLNAMYSLATPFNIVAFLRLTAMKDAPRCLDRREPSTRKP